MLRQRKSHFPRSWCCLMVLHLLGCVSLGMILAVGAKGFGGANRPRLGNIYKVKVITCKPQPTHLLQMLRYARQSIRNYEEDLHRHPTKAGYEFTHYLREAHDAIQEYEDKHHQMNLMNVERLGVKDLRTGNHTYELGNLRTAREAIQKYEEAHQQHLHHLLHRPPGGVLPPASENRTNANLENLELELQPLRDAHDAIKKYESSIMELPYADQPQIESDKKPVHA
mmetsp:Transcript_1202/g.2316  ORF Transcript_1202/g.2316 Transcript_1202/m.2316 type:complete len:226 (-) Transcript_1202:104-781(-)